MILFSSRLEITKHNMNPKIRFFNILILLTLLISCREKQTDINPQESQEYLLKGDFTSAAHPTSGIAKITKDKSKLIFENFKSDKGPDLNIYLCSNLNNIKSDYIDLGDIKGLNGNYSYSVNSSTNFSQYKYVVVWCVDFNVNFGYASLAP